MGGVDKMDQLLAYNGFSRRTFKWWRKQFFNLIDVAIINAYILYTLSSQDGKRLSYLQFKIKQLLHEAFHPVYHLLASLSSQSSCLSYQEACTSLTKSQPGQMELPGRGTACAVCSGKRGKREKLVPTTARSVGLGFVWYPFLSSTMHTKVTLPGIFQ